MRPLSSEEEQILSTKEKCPAKFLKLLFTGLAISSLFPIAYLAYVNNGNNLGYPALVFLDCGQQVYSMILSANHLLGKCEPKKVVGGDIDVGKARKNLVAAVKNFQKNLYEFYSNGDQSPLLYTRNVSALRKDWQALLEEILSSSKKIEKPSIPIKAVSAVFTASQLGLYAFPSYAGMQGFTGGDIGSSVATATAVTGVNAYLQRNVMTQALQKIWSDTKSIFNKTYKPSLPQVFLPKLYGLSRVVNAILSGLSYGFAGQVSDTYAPSPISQPQKIVSCVSTGFVVTDALQTTFDAFLLYLVKNTRLGNEKMRELISFNNHLRRFALCAELAPDKEIVGFYNDLTKPLQQKLMEESELPGVV